MRSFARAATLVFLLGMVPASALAQSADPAASSAPAAPPAAPPSSASAPSAPAPSAAPAPAPAPAGSASAGPATPPAPPKWPATGYGWSDDKPAAKAAAKPAAHHAPRAAHRSDAPNATMSGFESMADGSTRLFVELSKPTTYTVKTGKNRLTYLIKGAYAGRRNNTNPLVTVHFNTPVTNARLVPQGRDLKLIVHLRAKVEPSVTMDAGKDGSAVMHITFPKGDYLPAAKSPATKGKKAGAGAPAGAGASDEAAQPAEGNESSESGER
jgi:hypothetical protein